MGNSRAYPNIEGIHDFEIMHTADWDASVDLKGKSVAIIGNGASAFR